MVGPSCRNTTMTASSPAPSPTASSQAGLVTSGGLAEKKGLKSVNSRRPRQDHGHWVLFSGQLESELVVQKPWSYGGLVVLRSAYADTVRPKYPTQRTRHRFPEDKCRRSVLR